jgi:hypothetical protein
MMWIQLAGSAWRMRKHYGMSLLSVQHFSKKVGKFSTNLSYTYNPPNWSIKQVIRYLRESSIGDLLDQMG